jgi:phage portal protein BeeE
MLNGHPVWRRLPREARDRGLNAAVVFLEVMNILHDAVGVPYGFAPVEALEDTAAVTHLADQLAAELLGSLPR